MKNVLHIELIFFHPDSTVGFGVSPNRALRLAGCTAGGEFHPALKIYFVFKQSITNDFILASHKSSRIWIQNWTSHESDIRNNRFNCSSGM